MKEKRDSCCQGITLTNKQIGNANGEYENVSRLPTRLIKNSLSATSHTKKAQQLCCRQGVFHAFCLICFKAYSYTLGPRHCIPVGKLSFNSQDKLRI